MAKNGWKPWAVGIARSLLLAVVAFTVPTAIDMLTTSDHTPAGVATWVPVILVVLRSIEGVVDTKIAAGERQASLLKGGRLPAQQ